MASSIATSNESATRIQWMWQSNANPFSKTEPAEWSPYDDVDNLIIEEAFANNETHAMLDDYHIDFKNKMQISNNNEKNQRHVKRLICNRDDNHVRGERFTFTP